MSKIRTPYRYDFVGSFLRPQALKDAKAAYQAGDIGEDELEQVMQREIARIVEKQKELGFHVIARIHEASKYIPLERLCLSPQCGFASCEIGNKLTEEEQWAKLRLVREIATEVWGEQKFA